MQDFHEYNAGDYHDWFVEFTDGINEAVPEANVQLIPVASTMAELFTDGPLQGMSLDDLYVDRAPHGTETVYSLASMITYQETFGEMPPANFDVPDVINPLVANNYDAINTRIAEILGTEDTGGGKTPVVVEPNADPVVEGEYAELSQGEVAVIDVLANDSDPDGDALSLQSVGDAQFGTVEILDGRAVYTPDEGFSGSDSFAYIVTDNEGGDVETFVGMVPSVDGEEVTPTPEDPEEPIEIIEPEEPEEQPKVPAEPEGPAEPEPEEPVESESEETPDPMPQTAFAATAIETNATSLNDLDFASHAGVSQITNGVTLASQDEALLDGGPSEGAVQFFAQISVETSGLYEIGLASDEQAQVTISGLPVVGTDADDNGEAQSNSIYLTSGNHNVEVRYLDTDGAQSLDVTWFGPDTDGDVMPIGDTSTDSVIALFSDDVAARSDEEAFKIVTSEAEYVEKEDLLLF